MAVDGEVGGNHSVVNECVVDGVLAVVDDLVGAISFLPFHVKIARSKSSVKRSWKVFPFHV